MRKLISISLLLMFALLCASCSDDPATPEPEEIVFEATPPVNPQPAQERLFGVTISESSNGFLSDFAEAQKAGIQVAEISLAWNAVEIADGVYQDPDGLLAATAFYAANDISVLITFAVINTVQRTTPNHLDAYAWNDSSLIAAFSNLTDWVFAELPAGVNVVGVSVGNEVNYVLVDEQWTQYGEFLQAAVTHLHTVDTELKVGVKTTVYGGLFGDQFNNIRTLNQYTDVVMLNYYLMDEQFQVYAPIQVHNDFSIMVGHFPGRKLWLTEIGYQSGSEHCQSNQDQQAAFFHEIFTAWDLHRYEMRYLMIDWLHDASAQQLAEWAGYYGSADPAFLEYLGTLGLRTNGGQDKNAWVQVLVEAQARGWGE